MCRDLAAGREDPGHPLVGAAAVAVRHGLAAPGRVRLATRGGTVHAQVTPSADSAVLEERACTVGSPVPAGLVCEAVGLGPHAAAGPVRLASAGLGFACLPVDPVDLERARALPDKVGALADRVPALAGVFGVAVFVPGLPEVRSRVFVPEPVCAEDPATGSAAPAVAGCLALAQDAGPHPLAFHILQGTGDLGLSRLRVTVRRDRTGALLAGVGGRVRTLLRGQLVLDRP